MRTEFKVTEAPEESCFYDIVAGDNVINIPLFQREYKWTQKNLDQFWLDIDEILDGSKRSQFLGVVVTVPAPAALGRPASFDIVDGQQRLFTCYIAIMAAVKVALDRGDVDWALEAARSYLLLRPFSQYPTNTKLVPSAADRHQFRVMWDEITSHKSLRGKNTWDVIGRPVPPQSSGNPTGRLISQYRRIAGILSDTYRSGKIERIQQIIEIIVLKLSFVTISLRDPIAAPIIFERLNARGEKITTADLVRNEIFARVASDPTLAQTVFDNDWEPFSKKFGSREIDLEKLLFPYGLNLDENTTKADLFAIIRTKWNEFSDPREIIIDLDRYSSAIIALETGIVDDGIPSELKDATTRFHAMRAPSSIYAFFCRVIDEVRLGRVTPSSANAAFEIIESFLVRRAVCGYEPTGLHAVFKGLWREIAVSGNQFGAEAVERAIRQRKTVPWPRDDEFSDAIQIGDIYSRKICKYLIVQFEIGSHGESPKDNFWIEHVLPQSITEAWLRKFSNDEHERWKNTLANLIPLTSEMNNSEGQSEYLKKRDAFANSIFASARGFAKEFDDWTPEKIGRRAEAVGKWALSRWKH